MYSSYSVFETFQCPIDVFCNIGSNLNHAIERMESLGV